MIREKWSDNTGSYIRVVGDDKERMADAVLAAHPVRGVLPLVIELVNGHREYVYETSGYQSLGDRLEEKPLTKQEWLRLLKELLETGDDLEEYLLDSEHLVLSTESLFVREDGSGVGCIYIGESRQPLAEGLRSLVERILKYPEYDREQAEFIYRLHAALSRPGVTGRTIRDFLREEGEEIDSINTTPEKISRITGDKPSKKRRIPEQRDKGSLALPVGLLAAGVAIPTVCLLMGVFRTAVSGETDLSLAIPAFLFFILVAGYGAYRLWPKETPVVRWEDEDELTVCLLPETTFEKEGDRLPVIPVEAFPWKIGSDERKSDTVLDRPGIAPEHLRIEKESHAILLIDEESETGTTLNGKRLTPWEKHRMKDGDVVMLGTTGYVVEITE